MMSRLTVSASFTSQPAITVAMLSRTPWSALCLHSVTVIYTVQIRPIPPPTSEDQPAFSPLTAAKTIASATTHATCHARSLSDSRAAAATTLTIKALPAINPPDNKNATARSDGSATRGIESLLDPTRSFGPARKGGALYAAFCSASNRN